MRHRRPVSHKVSTFKNRPERDWARCATIQLVYQRLEEHPQARADCFPCPNHTRWCEDQHLTWCCTQTDGNCQTWAKISFVSLIRARCLSKAIHQKSPGGKSMVGLSDITLVQSMSLPRLLGLFPLLCWWDVLFVYFRGWKYSRHDMAWRKKLALIFS